MRLSQFFLILVEAQSFSILVLKSELGGVMVNTPARHAAGPGSIPGSGIVC